MVNNTARVDVRDLSGPIRVRGSYVFTSGLSGITNLSSATRAATRVRFPGLGPKSLPRKRRRRLLTPLDLMTFGYNPVLPAYPVKNETWKSKSFGPRPSQLRRDGHLEGRRLSACPHAGRQLHRPAGRVPS